MRWTGVLLLLASAVCPPGGLTADSRVRRQLSGQVRPPTARSGTTTKRPRPFSITDSIYEFSTELNRFIDGGNVVLSPFSIVSVLNMLLLGAGDNTYEQLRHVLRYPFEVDDLLIHQQSGIQLRALRRETDGVMVHIANRIFTDSAFNVIEQYMRDARDYYQSGVEQLEFGRNPDRAKVRINQWVGDHTNGQIREVFAQPPSRNTRMVGVNVVYFKSLWQTPFDPRNTNNLSFFLDKKQRVKIPTMFAELRVPHASYPQEGFSAVALPYTGGQYAMVVLLPDQAGEQPLQQLEQRLAGGRLQRVLADMRPANLSVWLPRFKQKFTLPLRNILQDMGATDLFQESRADMHRLSPDRRLFLGDVLHQAVIDVNEAGTEASAVTVTLVNRDRIASEFRANKPFLYIIRDNKTGVPLFYGRFVTPESAIGGGQL